MFSMLKGTLVSSSLTTHLYNRWKSEAASPALRASAASQPVKGTRALPLYRPNDWVHLYYAVESYKDTGGEVLSQEGWELVRTHSKPNSYFGAAYRHLGNKHIIIAHRGTQDLNDWISNLDFITRRLNEQEVSAWDEFAKKIVQEHGAEFSYSFTGHSLGGWLAQSCLWKYQDEFVKGSSYFDAFAVTLDDPGAREILEALQPRVESGHKIAVDRLDITAYLSHPNIVNTALGHVGSTYALFPGLNLTWLQNHTLGYTLKAHDKQSLLNEFVKEKGLPRQCLRVIDWPKVTWGAASPSAGPTRSALGYIGQMLKAYVSGDIQRGEYTGFFTYTLEEANHPEQLPPASQFQLRHGIHYPVQAFDSQVLPLRNMPAKMRGFLEELNRYSNREKVLTQVLSEALNEEMAKALMAYQINEQEELVLNKTTLSALTFREEVSKFLNAHPTLCQTSLSVLWQESIAHQALQPNALPGLLTELREQSQHTLDLLYRLSFQQGTARLYKINKATWEEVEQAKNEYQNLEKQLAKVQSLKLSLQALHLDKPEIINSLQVHEQQLILAQQSVGILLNYMQEKPEADKQLDTLIASLNSSTLELPQLDKALLLNRAYNLKAKIKANQPDKRPAIEYYKMAIGLLPNDALTWSNYGGLLSDISRDRKEEDWSVQAYRCFEKVYPLTQISPQQLPIVTSGMAYGYILLAQGIVQGKINPSKAQVPTGQMLYTQAQALLGQAISANPQYLNAHLFSAILYYDEGNYPKALVEVNNALSLHSTHSTALMRKGFILEKLGDCEEALNLLTEAKQQLSKDTGATTNASWVKEIEEHIQSIQAGQCSKGPKAKL